MPRDPRLDSADGGLKSGGNPRLDQDEEVVEGIETIWKRNQLSFQQGRWDQRDFHIDGAVAEVFRDFLEWSADTKKEPALSRRFLLSFGWQRSATWAGPAVARRSLRLQRRAPWDFGPK